MERCIKTSVLLAFLMLALQSGQVMGAADSILPLYSYPLQEIQQPAPQKSAVVIVHGWNSEAIDIIKTLPETVGWSYKANWPYRMGEQICESEEVQGRLDRRLPAMLKHDLLDNLDNDQLIRVCQGQN